MMAKGNVDETLISFVGNLTYIALLAFVIIAAINQLGIQTTSFIAVIGAAGLAMVWPCRAPWQILPPVFS